MLLIHLDKLEELDTTFVEFDDLDPAIEKELKMNLYIIAEKQMMVKIELN